MQALGFSPLGLTRLAANTYAVVSILAVFAALRPALRTHAEMAVHRAALASRSAAERAAVAAIGAVRRDRLDLLEMEALPLLRGIADGTLDPSDGAVRRRCAEHAATLRRALADRTSPPSGLLAGLAGVRTGKPCSADQSGRCTIEPLRTGISLHRPSYGIPPSGQGRQEIPVLDARSPRKPRCAVPSSHDPNAGVTMGLPKLVIFALGGTIASSAEPGEGATIR